jgi:hypothetical protein
MSQAGKRPEVRSWQAMRDRLARLLEKRTGEGVDAWNRRIRGTRLGDEPALRRWLSKQGVAGYAQTLLVWERFGYPEYITADVDDLINGQYADRPALRPILDATLIALDRVGDVAIQARKGYVSLVSKRRTFAVVQATTKTRVDLGLRLPGVKPGGRLESGIGVGNGTMTVKLPLTSAKQVDREAIGWLKRAYAENA